MKPLITFIILYFSINTIQAQKYIGKDWVQVQYELAAKKGINDKLYVQLSDLDSIKHIYHTISLIENDKARDREWVLIQTYFNKNGICFFEIHTDLGTKKNALQKAHQLLPGCKLVYSSSINHGLMDKYVVLKNDKILEYLNLQIGTTDEAPNDIMIILINRNLN